MTNEQKPEAIRLAEWIEEDMTCNGDAEIAAELRRQHAEIAELKQRLADSGCDLQAIKASPAPGGWVEWKGGECPLPGDVRVRVKFKDGIEGDDYPAGGWVWEHILGPDNIVAYRVLP